MEQYTYTSVSWLKGLATSVAQRRGCEINYQPRLANSFFSKSLLYLTLYLAQNSFHEHSEAAYVQDGPSATHRPTLYPFTRQTPGARSRGRSADLRIGK